MELKLSTNIVSRTEVRRLLRELSSLDDFFISASRREPGTPISPPRASGMLQQLANDNNINLLEAEQRQSLIVWLDQVEKKSPQVHISFASDPSPKAIDTILGWFRTNVHPQLLLQIGLQPNIVAGCIIRTPNKWFNLSLRSYLDKQRPYLVSLIAGADSAKR